MAINSEDMQKHKPARGEGFKPKEKAAKQQPQSGGAIAKTADQSMQSKAASGAEQLSLVSQKAQKASITTSFKAGQDQAMTDTIAETAGYLGTKAQLKAEATAQRITGIKAIEQNAQVALAEEVESLGKENDESDPLALLSEFTGSNHAQLLPSPFA